LPAASRSLRLFCVFRIGIEAKYNGKGQGRAEDPNGFRHDLHARIDGFETVGALSKAGVQSAASRPALAAAGVDAAACNIHGDLVVVDENY
jgi:hypothetical protein